MNATKTKKHVELWPDEMTSGRLDSQWVVSIESDDTNTTRFSDYDYDVAFAHAVELASRLNLEMIVRNRLGEAKAFDPRRY